MINRTHFIFAVLIISISLSSCVSKKKFKGLTSQHELTKNELFKANQQLDDCSKNLTDIKRSSTATKTELSNAITEIKIREEHMKDLRSQISDLRDMSSQQLDRVGDLTVLTKTANDNIALTIKSLENKDKYIALLQKARSKVDSINLALAVNLKSELQDGVFDNDIEIQVYKTVVFINISDKLLYKSGSAKLNENAKIVLSKIATIIKARPNLEVMVEGYTDDKSIRTSCLEDNWDLSVKRSTEVVRTLQKDYNIAPSRLIAAGRGEYSPIAENITEEGRSKNRRTRIVILPKLDEFYDLLNPTQIPK